MLETGLDNELLALDTGLENSAMAAEEQQAGTYWAITSRAKGGANNPFGGSATSNNTSQLVQMTEQELYKEYKESGQLQDHFGSWHNYKSYIIDSQEWIQTADWMLVAPEYEVGSKEWAFLNGEDLAWAPGEREKIQQKIVTDRVAARTSAFNQWLNGEEGQALMQKYGINPVIYNNDGDQFKWTGSGYQKTIKVDDHASLGDYVKAVLTSVVVGGVTGAMFNAAFNLVAPLVGANHGTAGKILNMLFTGAGAGAGGSIAYEDAMGALNNPNVIVNLQEEFGGQNGIDNEDGTRRYSDWNLPEGYIYNEARNAVIHVASGEEYPVTVGMYSWYVNLPDNEDASDGGAGSTSSSNASNSGSSGGTESNDGTTSPQQTGGASNANAGDIVGRQIHEAILKATNPQARQRLIEEWERYTGEKFSEDYYGDTVVNNENPVPVGYRWVPGVDRDAGGWVPVYEGDTIPSDGTYQAGATEPEGTPDIDWSQYCRIYPDSPVCANQGAITGGGNPGTNSASGGENQTSSGSTTSTSTSASTAPPATTPSTSTTPSNVPAGEIVGTGVWPASGTGGGTGAGNGPEGSGDGDGGGDGDGYGDGDGDGNGLSNLAASRGSSKPHWDRLFAAKEFQSRRGQFGKPTGTSRELNSSNYQMRQNLMNSLWDDLA